jgi:hypothetical protein
MQEHTAAQASQRRNLEQVVYPGGGSPSGTSGIAQTSRRVRAVSPIPNLIEELKRSATEIIDAVEKAKKIAESLK